MAHPFTRPQFYQNLWGILTRKVYVSGKQFATIRELKDSIRQAWASMYKNIDSLKLSSKYKRQDF